MQCTKVRACSREQNCVSCKKSVSLSGDVQSNSGPFLQMFMTVNVLEKRSYELGLRYVDEEGYSYCVLRAINGMQLSSKPACFDVHKVECRLIASRSPFEKIIQAPSGRRLNIPTLYITNTVCIFIHLFRYFNRNVNLVCKNISKVKQSSCNILNSKNIAGNISNEQHYMSQRKLLLSGDIELTHYLANIYFLYKKIFFCITLLLLCLLGKKLKKFRFSFKSGGCTICCKFATLPRIGTGLCNNLIQ